MGQHAGNYQDLVAHLAEFRREALARGRRIFRLMLLSMVVTALAVTLAHLLHFPAP